MEGMVGFEFRPNDEELVGHYLRNKIEGDTSLVDTAIPEVNICSYDPWDLRRQSKIRSKYPVSVWYFFSRRENGIRQNRRTPSGFWKLTGESVDVNDQWGFWTGAQGKIGHKRVLVFLKGRGSQQTKSDWVMHEFHYDYDLLPEHERTYVICRLEYKGRDTKFLFDCPTDPTPTFVPNPTNSEGSVVDRSFEEYLGSFYNISEFDSANQGHQLGNFNMQQQVPYLEDSCVDDPQRIWDYPISEIMSIMQVNPSNHCPKTPLTGVLADDSCDSDTDSMVSPLHIRLSQNMNGFCFLHVDFCFL
ncbi:hypothetical protein CARUB_v10009451mg [Capsella rubella]|uniref:NAC domain-containing protein n=1 Tax=Capsella rubella TaxID=81985 RepID=R0GPZ9_9BRAS|nr:hypothetical protein CARUB_v10009451mg [Capsella rubella]